MIFSEFEFRPGNLTVVDLPWSQGTGYIGWKFQFHKIGSTADLSDRVHTHELSSEKVYAKRVYFPPADTFSILNGY